MYNGTRTMQLLHEGYEFKDMTWQQFLTIELLGYHHECIPCVDTKFMDDGSVLATYRDDYSGELLAKYIILPGASYDQLN